MFDCWRNPFQACSSKPAKNKMSVWMNANEDDYDGGLFTPAARWQDSARFVVCRRNFRAPFWEKDFWDSKTCQHTDRFTTALQAGALITCSCGRQQPFVAPRAARQQTTEVCLIKELIAAALQLQNCCSYGIHHKNTPLFFYVFSRQKRGERLSYALQEEQEVCVHTRSVEKRCCSVFWQVLLQHTWQPLSHPFSSGCSSLLLFFCLCPCCTCSLKKHACMCVHTCVRPKWILQFFYPKGKLSFVAIFCSGE